MSDSLRVLVVDDEPDIREVAVLALGLDPGLQARSAGTGAEALELLGAGAWRPDLILLDFMMAGMDGLSTLEAVRELPGCEDLPVVFMTARTRDADVRTMLAAGAVDVITKPFSPLDLAQQVRAVHERARLADGPTP